MGYCHKNNVAGVTNNKWCNNDRENFTMPVSINREDFCSAVDRCLAAAERENNHHHHNCHCGCKRRY